MPFCHLQLTEIKPKNLSYLWKQARYPENPTTIGEHILKRRFDLKMPAWVCQEILGIDKKTLADWELGKHRPNLAYKAKIIEFLGYEPECGGFAAPGGRRRSRKGLEEAQSKLDSVKFRACWKFKRLRPSSSP